MGNTFGKLFTISTWGESHGPGVGVTIDGCPPRVPVDLEAIQADLARRRPGQSRITTPRDEADRVEILSGVHEGVSTGAPIGMFVRNKDARSQAYDHLRDVYRPSHADYTYDAKYGIRSWQGGGRASARETIGRVAAAAVAKSVLREGAGDIEFVGFVERIHDIDASIDVAGVQQEDVEANIVRCPDSEAAERMVEHIEETRKQGDSLGGVVGLIVRNVPPGLGEPVFDRLEADLAKAMLSLPASKGFEIGSGFGGTRLTGSQHNDAFYRDDQRVRTRTNRSGGVQGGISNGEDIYLRVAFKPTATINKEQETVTKDGEATQLRARGRHDPCVVPRAVPIVEAMAALVLVDHWMRQRGQCGDA